MLSFGINIITKKKVTCAVPLCPNWWICRSSIDNRSLFLTIGDVEVSFQSLLRTVIWGENGKGKNETTPEYDHFPVFPRFLFLSRGLYKGWCMEGDIENQSVFLLLEYVQIGWLIYPRKRIVPLPVSATFTIFPSEIPFSLVTSLNFLKSSSLALFPLPEKSPYMQQKCIC